MKPYSFYITVAISLASLITFAEAAPTQTGKPVIFGKDAPFQLNDLPPKSRLRQALEGRPQAARQHAMNWLHTFSFPESDTSYLQVDPDGGIFYIDENLPEPELGAGESAANLSTATAIPPVDTFKLHSRPGAGNVLFLDFDGHTISGTAWNSSASTFIAQPFDTDGYPATFSSGELSLIAEIWHRVAEDLAPFNIDVTTELPSVFSATVGRVLFTKDVDANGTAMPSKGAGGVAYVNVWGSSNYASYYSPALVYYNNLASHPPYMSEAASHEFGHNLGLSHDGTSTTGYYKGLGSGYVSWAPIMGVGYYTNVTQWSKGEYPDANNKQDDLNIIAGKLLYRADDHANSIASASQLLVETDGSIVVSNPQNDPDNVEPENKGIIETATDIDTFYFDASQGTVNITVTPAWAAYYRSSLRGGNVDIEARLYNQSGTEIAFSDPTNETSATISVSVSAGRYYLAIAGVGNSVTPYSDYGSLGEYFISGTVPPASSSTDTTPPTPNPMTWESAPAAQGKGSIAMTAKTASDDSGVVQYQFQCVAGGQGCVNSTIQASPSFVVSGLAEGTAYSFQVKALDAAGNTTNASPIASATTIANSAPVAVNDSVTINEDNSVSISVLSNDNDADNDPLVVSSAGSAAHGVVTNNGSSVSYQPNANYYGGDSFTYTASDGFGGASTATVSITVSPVNDAPKANPDSISVLINKTVAVNVLTNDSDIDGDTLSILSVTQGTKGKVVNNGNSVSYTAGNKQGSDSFTYTVKDSQGMTSTATISVAIKRR